MEFFIVIAVALLFLAFAVRDFRRKDYVWSARATAAFVALIAMPFPTHSVSIDLPSKQ